jgi:hypothetical protein
LNSRPKAYESSALPLSYPGEMVGGMSHISCGKSTIFCCLWFFCPSPLNRQEKRR